MIPIFFQIFNMNWPEQSQTANYILEWTNYLTVNPPVNISWLKCAVIAVSSMHMISLIQLSEKCYRTGIDSDLHLSANTYRYQLRRLLQTNCFSCYDDNSNVLLLQGMKVFVSSCHRLFNASPKYQKNQQWTLPLRLF